MFVDTGDGLSISEKHIEAIKALDELSCLVYTNSNQYEVPMPRSVLISLLSSKNETKGQSNVEKLLVQIYSQQATPRP